MDMSLHEQPASYMQALIGGPSSLEERISKVDNTLLGVFNSFCPVCNDVRLNVPLFARPTSTPKEDDSGNITETKEHGMVQLAFLHQTLLLHDALMQHNLIPSEK